MKYENYIFDLYGTLVDIHKEKEKTELWDCRGTEKRVCVPHGAERGCIAAGDGT